MAFLDLEIVNLAYVEQSFAKFAAEIPPMLITVPKLVGKSMMDVLVMPRIREQTPVDTGALRAQSDWAITDSNPEQTTIEVFSTAQNVRTGYEYAHARAYGFTTVAGTPWEPPEDPYYPIAGFQAANVGSIGTILPMGSIMKIVPL